MAGAHPLSVPDATTRPGPGRTGPIGTETEIVNTDTRTGIAHARILTGTKERGQGCCFTEKFTFSPFKLHSGSFSSGCGTTGGHRLSILFFISSFRSSRDGSSHTRDKEPSPTQERSRDGAAEGWRENKVEHADWEERGRSTSPDMTRDRERERSLSLERDRRSSSEERESGEI